MAPQLDTAPDPSDGLPCPFCGYDVRAQVEQDAAKRCRASRCPECGEVVDHEQIADNLPLLCEGRSPLLAFFLVPLDLLQLLFPRGRLARRTKLGPPPKRGLRFLLIALPLWLLSGVCLAVWVSLLSEVTFVPGCDPDRDDPFALDANQAVWDHIILTPDVGVAVALFVSAFGLAVLVLALGLRWLRPSGDCGQVQFMPAHALRRTMYVVSPLYCGLVFACFFVLVGFVCESEYGPVGITKHTTMPCFLVFLPLICLERLLRAGYSDGRDKGAWVYLGLGALAIGVWFLWVGLGGGLFIQRNIGQILHMLNLRFH